MAKKKTQSAFFCQSCGTQSPKWLGKCPQCNEWNTFVEEIISKESDIKVEGGEPKTNKARFKAIRKKKQPSPETTEVEEDESAVAPTNIAGSY